MTPSDTNPVQGASGRASFWKRLRPLFPYVLRYRRGILLGAAALIISNAIWMTFPIVLGRAIDTLTTGTTQGRLLLFAAILLGIAVAKGVFQYLMRWILIGISRDIEYDLRNDLFRHLQKQSARFYSTWRVGDLMSRATNDLNAVRMMVGPAAMYTSNALVAFPMAIAMMVYLDWRLTIWLLVPVPVVSAVVMVFGRQIHERFERIQAKMSDLTARVQENLAGVRLLRAYTQEDAELAAFECTNREYVESNRRLIRVQGMFIPSIEMLVTLAFLAVLWLGGRAVLAGDITVGSFVAFMQYMFQLTWPMIALGWVVNIFERGTASLGRLNQLLTAVPEVVDTPEADVTREMEGEIEFRDLSFSYNGTPVLRNVNLKVAAGETLAIVGPTGSGKSTLVHLLGRLYDAPPGTILIDGQPITAYPLERLRGSLGFVPQETFLFSHTLHENIALGVPQADREQTVQAAEIAGLVPDIESFPQKYETRVGERGITLSGGQRQRTAIARALLRNPKILILDDALSSVDTHTEELILRRLTGVMRERTSIIISHRISTVRHADQIVVLNGGRIVERGTHEELLDRGGYYYDLYQKQLLEEELERT